jgi:hypothetical protein
VASVPGITYVRRIKSIVVASKYSGNVIIEAEFVVDSAEQQTQTAALSTAGRCGLLARKYNKIENNPGRAVMKIGLHNFYFCHDRK